MSDSDIDWQAVARDLRVALEKRNTLLAAKDAALEEAGSALQRIASDDWGLSGGRCVKGNAQLPGCEEFYRGYNGGIDNQFKRTREIAEEALARLRAAKERA